MEATRITGVRPSKARHIDTAEPVDWWLVAATIGIAALLALALCCTGWWVWNFTGSIDEQALRGLAGR